MAKKKLKICTEDDPNPILDLTRLLVSGRASEPLLDFLGSGEQMSERVNCTASFLSKLLISLSGTTEMGNNSDRSIGEIARMLRKMCLPCMSKVTSCSRGIKRLGTTVSDWSVDS